MNNRALLAKMKSIRQTIQISNAQKLIAASHISKARRLLKEAEPYHERIRQAIAEVLTKCPEASSRYLDVGESTFNKRGVLVISANRGLAGGYNSNLSKFIMQNIGPGDTSRLLVLGKVGQGHLAHAGYDVDTSFEHPVDPPSLFAARELAEHVMRYFERGVIDCFDVAYTHYYSAARLKPTIMRLFPLKPAVFGEAPKRGDAVFAPSPDAVLEMLIPKYLKGFLYGCLVHAWSSELASRVAAMDNAIRNGNEMLENLSLLYNRTRQAMITQEITEIVAGVSSMAKEE